MKLENELYEIVSCRTDSVVVRWRPESVIYKAHFPGNPITPGVCIVGLVAELAQKLTEQRLVLRAIRNVKFVDIIRPGDGSEATFVFDKMEQSEDILSVRGKVEVNERAFTKFSMTFDVVR